jgi:hypothetical protein
MCDKNYAGVVAVVWHVLISWLKYIVEAGGVAQAVEHLPSKCREALSSNPSDAKYIYIYIYIYILECCMGIKDFLTSLFLCIFKFAWF